MKRFYEIISRAKTMDISDPGYTQTVIPRDKKKRVSLEMNEFVRKFKKEIHRSTKVFIDNVAEYYFQHPKDRWFFNEFPPLRLPWPEVFFEYAIPASFMGTRKTFAGVFVEELGQDEFDHFKKTSDINIRCPRLLVMNLFLLEKKAKNPCYISLRGLGLSEEGQVINVGNGVDMLCRGYFRMDQETGQREANRFDTFFRPALLALGFCNCRNVNIVPHQGPVLKQTQKCSKGTPIRRHYLLQIEPGMSQPARTQTTGDDPRKSLHICRGHFAHYTKENPLFGKYAGSFWKPMHTRGSMENGIVTKDYGIKRGVLDQAM